VSDQGSKKPKNKKKCKSAGSSETPPTGSGQEGGSSDRVNGSAVASYSLLHTETEAQAAAISQQHFRLMTAEPPHFLGLAARSRMGTVLRNDLVNNRQRIE